MRRLRFHCSSHPAHRRAPSNPLRPVRCRSLPLIRLQPRSQVVGSRWFQIDRAVHVLPHNYQDENFPAVTYFPTPSPGQYRRRWGVSLPCSGWERVGPPRLNHQKVVAQLCTRRKILASVFVTRQSPNNKHPLTRTYFLCDCEPVLDAGVGNLVAVATRFVDVRSTSSRLPRPYTSSG